MHLPDLAQLLSPAQVAGYLAFVLGVTAFLQRNDRRLKLFLVSECVVYLAHFTLLGNPTAAAASGLSAVRTTASLRYRSRRLAVAVMITYLALGALLSRSAVGWLPVVGSCLGTWGLFTQHGIRMRLLVLASTFLWLANNVISGSVGGTLLEALIATASITTIVRMALEKRRGEPERADAAPPTPELL